MLTTDQLQQFTQAFPQFSEDQHLLKQLQAQASLSTIPNNTVICGDGDTSTALPLMLSGDLRVYKISEQGKEITLYHINDCESCVLSASSILGHKQFPAIAQAVEDSEVFILSSEFVRTWLLKSTAWQQFIFGLVAKRLGEVINVVEEVAFQRVDKRIANYILHHLKQADLTLHATHQQIAIDIGTAREVVSRVLRDLEIRNVLELKRGYITVLNHQQLQKISEK